MKHVPYVLVTLGLISGCGGKTSPTDFSSNEASALCNRMQTCGAAFVLGVTLDECKTAFQAIYNLTMESTNNGCPTGTKFDSSKADACVNAVKAESCMDAANGTTPAQCDSPCS